MRPPLRSNAKGKKAESPTISSSSSPPLSGLGPPPDSRDPGEQLLQALLAVADDVSRVLADARREASSEIVRRVAVELPGAVDRLVLERYYRLVLLAAGALVFALAAGAVLGYWVAHQGF